MRVVTSEAYLGQCPFQEVDAGRVVPAWTRRSASRTSARRCASTAATPSPSRGPYGDDPILAVHDAAMLAWLDRAWEDWSRVGHTRPLFPSTFALDRLMGSAGGPPRAPSAVRPAAGYWCMDSSTGIVEGTTAAFRGAVDIALTAVDSVLDGAGVEYALCRPPGHHAGADYFGGYCFVNNAAIAVRTPRRAGRRAWRCSTSTTTTATARRRSSTTTRPCWSRPARRPRLRVPVVHRPRRRARQRAGDARQPQRPAARRHDRRRLPGGARGRARGRGGPSRGARGRLARRGRLPRRPDRLLRAHDRRLRAHRRADRRAGRAARDPAGGRLRRGRDRRQRRGLPRRRARRALPPSDQIAAVPPTRLP